MKFLSLLAMLFVVFVGKTQNRNYSVSGIAAAMISNAHAVKRFEEISFSIVNTGETILKRKWAITVLDAKGEEYSQLVEFYDQLASIKSIEGSLFDANGRRLKQLKKKDLTDRSAIQENNL